MKYAFEIGSDAMIYIRSFIKIGLANENLIGAIRRHIDTQTLREHGDCESLLLFFSK
jgi:hypothetical protein